MNWNDFLVKGYKELDNAHLHFNVEGGTFEFDNDRDARQGATILGRLYGFDNVIQSGWNVIVSFPDDVDENLIKKLTEDLIVIEPYEAKEKLANLKHQIENEDTPENKESLMTLMDIYLFQTYKPSDKEESNITDAEWEEYSKFLNSEKEKYQKHLKESNSETIELYYDKLPIKTRYKVFNATEISPEEWDYKEGYDSWTYEVDKDYVIDVLYDTILDEKEFENYSEEELVKYINDNFDDLLDKYYKEVLKYFEDSAIEDYEEHKRDEDDWDDYRESLNEDLKSKLEKKLSEDMDNLPGVYYVVKSDMTKKGYGALRNILYRDVNKEKALKNLKLHRQLNKDNQNVKVFLVYNNKILDEDIEDRENTILQVVKEHVDELLSSMKDSPVVRKRKGWEECSFGYKLPNRNINITYGYKKDNKVLFKVEFYSSKPKYLVASPQYYWLVYNKDTKDLHFIDGLQNLEYEGLEEDIEKHDTLNPKLFDNNELKPEVKEALLKVVDAFVEDLKDSEIDIKVKDVVVIGSNVNYNYNKDSDIDLHIIADSDISQYPGELLTLLYSAYRSIFNKNYDITIKGIPCEVYVELDELHGTSNGVYSLYNGWLKEPEQKNIPDIDMDTFNKLFDEWEDKYFALLDEIGITPEEMLALNEREEDKEASEKVYNFIEDIYDLRKESIAQEGEFGLGNLVFKEFRNLGYLDALKQLTKILKGKELSLENINEDFSQDTLESIYKYTLDNDGGTFDLRSGKSLSGNDSMKNVYSVEFKSHDWRKRIGQVDKQEVLNAIESLLRSDSVKDADAIGTWSSGENERPQSSIGLNKIFKDREEAEKFALDHNQKAIGEFNSNGEYEETIYRKDFKYKPHKEDEPKEQDKEEK